MSHKFQPYLEMNLFQSLLCKSSVEQIFNNILQLDENSFSLNSTPLLNIYKDS